MMGRRRSLGGVGLGLEGITERARNADGID